MNQPAPMTLLLSVAILAGCAAVPPANEPRAGAEAAHARLMAAYNACDAESFVAAYAPGFSFTTSNTLQAVTATDGLRAYLALGCRPGAPSPSAELTTQTIAATGREAVLVGQYLFKVPTQGQVAQVAQNFTLLMRPVDGAWRVVTHHVSLVPTPARR